MRRERGVLSQRAVRGISHAHMSLNEISCRMSEPAINLRVYERANAKCSASSELRGGGGVTCSCRTIISARALWEEEGKQGVRQMQQPPHAGGHCRGKRAVAWACRTDRHVTLLPCFCVHKYRAGHTRVLRPLGR